jgi:hypothetical protein
MRNALRSRQMLAGISAGLGLLIACVAWFVPYLTRERGYLAGVPVPPPFSAQTPVGLDPGSEACLSDVAFDTDAELVDLTVLAGRRPRPPIEVIARGRRYVTAATVPGDYQPPMTVRTRIDPPKESVIGTLCIKNRGKRRVELLGTADARTGSARPVTQIDGVEIVPDISVSLVSSDEGSVVTRLGRLVDRVAAFKPGLFGLPLLLWIVLLLAALGIPAAAVYAMLSSFREAD